MHETSRSNQTSPTGTSTHTLFVDVSEVILLPHSEALFDSLDHVYMPRCIELLPRDWLIRCNKQKCTYKLATLCFGIILSASFFHSWGLTT